MASPSLSLFLIATPAHPSFSPRHQQKHTRVLTKKSYSLSFINNEKMARLSASGVFRAAGCRAGRGDRGSGCTSPLLCPPGNLEKPTRRFPSDPEPEERRLAWLTSLATEISFIHLARLKQKAFFYFRRSVYKRTKLRWLVQNEISLDVAAAAALSLLTIKMEKQAAPGTFLSGRH